ncbi:hypothetical protein T492DRAFT_997180 [Pavlovales sp. CCMP2436]|nr:hypothetical protein T492DRAFT_997180 [Pavlovales sp. CCMP2436]
MSLDPSVSQRLGPVETCRATDVPIETYTLHYLRVLLIIVFCVCLSFSSALTGCKKKCSQVIQNSQRP